MTKELQKIYKSYPTHQDCINYLEKIIWKDNPICPYCKVAYYSKLSEESRYHCNNCNASFSVTVKTILHKTRVDLQKWFYLIRLFLKTDYKPTLRELGSELEVTKDTALRMSNQIKLAISSNNEWIYKI